MKPASLDSGSCPFCLPQQVRSSRNPLPGLVLAATMAAVPGCSDSEPAPGPGGVDAGPVYGIAVDASAPDATAPDAGPVYGIAVDASTSDAASAPIYGVAPESE